MRTFLVHSPQLCPKGSRVRKPEGSPRPSLSSGTPMWVLLRQRPDLSQPRAKEPVVGAALVTDCFFSELGPRPRLGKPKNNGGEVLGRSLRVVPHYVSRPTFPTVLGQSRK